MSLLILFIIAVCLLVYAVKVSRRNKEESEKQKTAEQPTHFDLLDDNGDPIPSSDDRSRASASHPIDEPSVQNLRYFCIKDKGYHVSVWPKYQGFQGIDYIEFNIAGITHGEHVDDHLGEFVANLEPEPTNPYDEKAIKIVTSEGHRVGYVPKDQTTYVRDFATLPCRCYCYIGTNDGMYFTDCYIKKESR
jgi:hypothetical protein